MEKEYTNMFELTSQFRFCGNPFRVDTYRGCDFGCSYCFANNRNGNNFNGKNNFEIGSIKIIQKYFEKINDGKSYEDISVELLRKKVPLHLGGMSDPFQPREWKYGITKELLKQSHLHQYPMVISTKTAYIPDEYFEYLSPNIHCFQISLISTNETFLKTLEPNTPSAKERIQFIKKLHNMGFWVGLRIQPMIDVYEAEKLLEQVSDFIDYCTIEHLKLPKLNTSVWNNILKNITLECKRGFVSNPIKPEYEIKYSKKLKNIEYLKSKFHEIKIGCGDNDLHHLSDSLNCCGLDTMPCAFCNWLKYNSMFIKMTGDDSQWYPKCYCGSTFNSTKRKKGFNFKDYVDEYFKTLYGSEKKGIFD